MSICAALYSPSTLYSRDEKGWQFKSPKNSTVRTGYFWDAKNRLNVLLNVLLDKPFSKILWDFSVVCLNVTNIVVDVPYSISMTHAPFVHTNGNELIISSGRDYQASSTFTVDFATGRATSTKSDFSFGYYEINARIPAGTPLGSAFWMYDYSTEDEIDVFEEQGWLTNSYSTNFHTSKKAHPLDIPVSTPLSNGYHKYGISWAPNMIQWYIDNKIIRTYSGTDVPGSSTRMNIIISVNMPDNRATKQMIETSKTSNVPFDDFKVEYVMACTGRPTNALFVTLDNQANLNTLSDFTDWNRSWDIILSGNFDGTGNYNDLFLYDREIGKALFVSTDGNGNISTIKEYTDWRKTWTEIVPGNFDGDNITDLLLYDKSNGTGFFYISNGVGQTFIH